MNFYFICSPREIRGATTGAKKSVFERDGNANYEFMWKGMDLFLDTAKSFKPVTDKVTTHTYQIMYGKFLLPYYHLNPSMKMLEIGLGCDMSRKLILYVLQST